MTTEEVGCLRSDVGRQKAEVGTTELRRGTNTNLTDGTNMREFRRETNTNLTDDTNMRELRRETNTNLTDDTNMRELRRETNTIATPHAQRENLTDGTNMRDHGDERTQMTRIKRIYGTTEMNDG